MHITGIRSNELNKLLAELPSIDLGDLREGLRLYDAIDQEGGHAPDRVLADAAVRVGNLRLWMPSVGALRWIERGLEWFAGDETELLLWQAYCLAHSRRPQVLGRIGTSAAARRAVDAWEPTVGCTLAELAHACAAAMSGFPDSEAVTDPTTASTDALRFAAACLANHGGRLDEWLWAEPLQRAVWLSRELAAAGKRSEGSASRGLVQATRRMSAWIKAMREKNRGGGTREQ